MGRDRLTKDKRHKKSKKRSGHSIQAWNESNGQIWRPSSAPNNEADHYSGNLRANSSQSFQDQYVSHNPSLYQRVPKLSRHQRVRVGPVYHDSYQTNDIPIHSRLSDYHSLRTQSHPMRSFRGVDNMGYLRTNNEPVVIDDLNDEHNLQRTRPLAHNLPYNDKLRTIPKRTEILYIQSPVNDDHEEYLRSVSQNEMPYVDERRLDGRFQVFDPNVHVIENLRESDRTKAMIRTKQRHVIFNEHNVSDMVIPEEGVVPGMMPKEGAYREEQMTLKTSLSGDHKIPVSDDRQRVEVVSDSRDVANQSKERNGLLVDRRANENSNYSPFDDETIQITSVKGVPVSIELKDSRESVAQKSSVNESVERESNRNVKTRGLVKDNSVETSDHSCDSDSGIGKPIVNPRIELEMKNSGLIEKKSIFTIAYNDVKTRHLQSAESNTE